MYEVGLSSNQFSIAGRIPKPFATPEDMPITESPQEPEEPESVLDDPTPIEEGKANAVIIMLVRNRELRGALNSMLQLEEKFNHRYEYPWVFLNEEPFTDDFKELVI